MNYQITPTLMTLSGLEVQFGYLKLL